MSRIQRGEFGLEDSVAAMDLVKVQKSAIRASRDGVKPRHTRLLHMVEVDVLEVHAWMCCFSMRCPLGQNENQ